MGWLKLNTGGARDNKGNTVCGGIIRGNEGEWLSRFVKKNGVCSVYIE